MSTHLEVLSYGSNLLSKYYNLYSSLQINEIITSANLILKELSYNVDVGTVEIEWTDKYIALRHLVRYIIRHKSVLTTGQCNNKEMLYTFMRGLKLSDECIELLLNILFVSNIKQQCKIKIQHIEWRIDISLCGVNLADSNSNAERRKCIMNRDTSIVLLLTLSDGSFKCLRLSLIKFHELRYNIAVCLKNILILKQRRCIKQYIQ